MLEHEIEHRVVGTVVLLPRAGEAVSAAEHRRDRPELVARLGRHGAHLAGELVEPGERRRLVDRPELGGHRERERAHAGGGIGGEQREGHRRILAAWHHGSVPKTRIDEADGLTVADVIHAKFTALPASATIGDVREWFAASTSRRQAFVADDGRYAGSLTLADIPDDADPAPAGARRRPGRADGLARRARHDGSRSRAAKPRRGASRSSTPTGTLLGVVAVTGDLQCFCGTDSGA